MEKTDKTEKAETAAANKEKALSSAISVIEKQYGKGAIMRLGKDEIIQEIMQVISKSRD